MTQQKGTRREWPVLFLGLRGIEGSQARNSSLFRASAAFEVGSVLRSDFMFEAYDGAR